MRKKKEFQCLLQTDSHRQRHALGLGCVGATGHLCPLLLPYSIFQSTQGEEMQISFCRALWSVQLEQPPASQQSRWLHLLQLYFSTSDITEQSRDSIKSVTPAASTPGARQAARAFSCFHGTTGSPVPEGMHTQSCCDRKHMQDFNFWGNISTSGLFQSCYQSDLCSQVSMGRK